MERAPPKVCSPALLAVLVALSLGVSLHAPAATPLRASFDSGHDYPTGNGPVGLALGDFRGIGKQDIAVVNNNDNTVSVLLGNGDGTFAPKQDFPVCAGPFRIAVGDLNQDGKPDLVVLCPSSLSVLIGNGDGTFQAHVDYNVQIFQHSSGESINVDQVLVGDLNGDGYPDVTVIANRLCLSCDGGVLVLLNQGVTSPGVLEAPTLALRPMADALLVDLNGDQKLDLAYADNDTADGQLGPGWAFGNGAGGFTGDDFNNLYSACPGQTSCNNIVNSVAAGDLNSDGKIDLIYSGDNGPCVMLGDGTGGFNPCAFQTEFPNVRGQLALADLSNRGKLDVVSAAARANTTDWIVQTLIGTGNASFVQGPTLYDQWSAPVGGLAAVDLNGDGLPEVIVSLTGSNTIRVWLNTSVADQAPTASNVNAATLTGNAVNGMLVGTQLQGGALTYIVVSNPSHGTVQISDLATGAFTYTPTSGYFGADAFTYQVTDGYLNSNVATVTLAVHSIPVATSDSIATTAGVAVNGTLKGSDPGSNPLTFSISGQGGKGTAVVTTAVTGSFTYTPTAGQTGNDSFTFTVSNGFATATATESVVIGAAQSSGGGGGGGGGGGATDFVSLGLLLALLARRRIRQRVVSKSSSRGVGERRPEAPGRAE